VETRPALRWAPASHHATTPLHFHAARTYGLSRGTACPVQRADSPETRRGLDCDPRHPLPPDRHGAQALHRLGGAHRPLLPVERQVRAAICIHLCYFKWGPVTPSAGLYLHEAAVLQRHLTLPRGPQVRDLPVQHPRAQVRPFQRLCWLLCFACAKQTPLQHSGPVSAASLSLSLSLCLSLSLSLCVCVCMCVCVCQAQRPESLYRGRYPMHYVPELLMLGMTIAGVMAF